MDKNVLGVPKERYGFSNNVRPILTAPRWEKAKFPVGNLITEVLIEVK